MQDTHDKSLEQTLREFIVESFLFGQDDGLTVEVPLLERRILDSTGILEVVAFVSSRWGITIDDEELLPNNFGSIRRIAAFIGRRLGEKAA